MFLAFKLSDIVTVPFGWLLYQLYQLTSNYGVALILFAVLVKLILHPVQAKSKKSMMKMSRLTPRIQEIQSKYANDQAKQNQLVQELYKSEGVSMFGGCLWSFVPLLILIPLYQVVRQPILYMLRESIEATTQIVSIVKEQLPDLFNARNTYYEQMIAAPHLPAMADAIKAAVEGVSDRTLEGLNFSFLGINLGDVPQANVFAWGKVTWNHIGSFLIPLLSAGSQVLSMLISQKMNNSLVTDDKGIQDEETAKKSQQNQSNKVMMWMMPVMSLWIGFTVPTALSLYWLIQGVVSIVQDVYLTQHYRKIYDAEDAERLKKHLAEVAIEEEKERLRAERRAANPEGITENTSKKKMQQKKQQEEAAAKAAAAKEYAVKKGTVQEEEPSANESAMSGISSRPYCKGRAYDPNRYGSNSTEE